MQQFDMTESAELERLLTQINCRITGMARLRDVGTLGLRDHMKAISSECRTFAMICSRLTGAKSGDRSQQFDALAKTWLELAAQLELSEALLSACLIAGLKRSGCD
jgi:hypothetical protein